MHVIGKSVLRKDATEKVTGRARYTHDDVAPGLLHARLLLSPFAHARILSVDTSDVWSVPGVRAVLTGKYFPQLTGPILADRPPIALDVVRYHGEVVALVVAEEEHQAMLAVQRIKVEYEPLPVVNSPYESFQTNSPLLHEQLGSYKTYGDVIPVPGTNIANHTKIRKGDIKNGFAEAEVVVETTLAFPPADHVAMEPRCAIAEILPGERVHVETSSQAPYMMRDFFDKFMNVKAGNVVVHTPLVGGGFGGKGSVQLEYLAYLASHAVGGRKVKLANTREQDMITSPCHIGLEAKIKLGATRDGRLTAAEITYWFDGGAYSEMAVVMSLSAAGDCTGPYRIDNVWCDSFCMYTNHPYATAFRGFGHPELTFVIERAMDQLAKQLNLDPFDLRLKNAILPGDLTPTMAKLTRSNIGDVPECLLRLREMMNWEQEPPLVQVSPTKVRAKGVTAFWKTSSTPRAANSSAVITFNPDGSLNLNFGAVEIGQGTKTALSQIVAEKFQMDVDMVHPTIQIHTDSNPEHWKTVASSTTFMAGRAALEAADDAIQQLKRTASIVLRSLPEDLEVGQGRVYQRDDPETYIEIRQIALGYEYPHAGAIEGPIIGRGNYVVQHLKPLDPETGEGKLGMEWTVAAQGVEIELDLLSYEYTLLNAYTVIDAGRVINPALARGQVMGGMHMGLSWATREGFYFDENAVVLNPDLRRYKLTHFGQNPKFHVGFVETPMVDAPYGLRGIGEYGTIAMAPALANALSLAAGVELTELPLIPERIWRARQEAGG